MVLCHNFKEIVECVVLIKSFFVCWNNLENSVFYSFLYVNHIFALSPFIVLAMKSAYD